MEPALLKSRSDDVRSLLADSVPWSPLDFIKGISPAGDRSVQLTSLLRELDAGDDLRIACPIATGLDVAVCAERLPWDSAFFGYDVARLHGVFPLQRGGYSPDADYAPAICELLKMARSRGIRYLFGVIDARDLPTIRALTAIGFALIETRLYFHCSLRNYRHRRRYRCRLATAADVESLTALARTIDNPYDRFHADPFIDRADARRLIDTWLRASVLDGYADATFIADLPNPGAACTIKYHQDKAAAWGVSIGQLILALAAPRAGNGFVGVIAELTAHMKERGLDHSFFTTQIANAAAIRVGEHLGYRVGRGEYVFRLLL